MGVPGSFASPEPSVRSTFYQLCLGRRLQFFLSDSSLATFIHAFITSRLDYYNVLSVHGIALNDHLEAAAGAESIVACHLMGGQNSSALVSALVLVAF